MSEAGLNVLSLFDGMSCAQLALNKAGLDYDNYYASEIDKYAIKVCQANYPKTIQVGDVTKLNFTHPIDLLIGGSPCQGFSFSGKQLNFDDPRSKLFFEIVRLKNELNPKYFLLENVRMKQESKDIISEQLGVQPIVINSALVSAQNRVRYYWTNIPNVTQPGDKGIMLKDILEDNFIYKYNKKGKLKKNQSKASCLTAGANSGGNHSDMDILRCIQVGEADIKGHDSIKRVYHPEGKAPTLTTMGGGNREPKVAIQQRNHGFNKGGLKTTDGKTPTLTSNSWEHNNHLSKNGLMWRRLTPIECERLQTVPDNYTACDRYGNLISNTQRYKMLGNGFTVDVIAHILKGITKEKIRRLVKK